MNTKHIGIFVGSLRKGSYSKSIARYIEGLSSESFNYKVISIENLPLYNQDYDDENSAPETYEKFRQEVKPLDGVVFITPEYNRSVPGVLKNAIDVGSRPYGKNVWAAKPGAVISSSTGVYGGFGANQHLRQSLVFLNVLPLQQPECYLSKVDTYMSEQGDVDNDKLKGILKKFIAAFEVWVLTVTE